MQKNMKLVQTFAYFEEPETLQHRELRESSHRSSYEPMLDDSALAGKPARPGLPKILRLSHFVVSCVASQRQRWDTQVASPGAGQTVIPR
jgi:hypothetical protein